MTKFEKTLLSILLTVFLWAIENYSKTAGAEREYKQIVSTVMKEL